MEFADFHPTHKAKLWLLATIVVIVLGVAGTFYYVNKTRQLNKQNQVSQTQQTVDTTAAQQAKVVSDELKNVNLAEVKDAVEDIKSILSAF